MTPQIAFLLNQALQSLSNGNPRGAELYLGQALKLNPKNTHTLRFLGVCAAQQKQWDQALDFFEKSIKSDPKNAIAYSNIGNVFLEQKKYEEAIQSYDKAISLNSNDAEAWSNKGNALTTLKRYEEALEQYDRALALNPQYAEAWSNKGNTLASLRRYQEALEQYDRALAINPQYAEAWSNKGNALNETRSFEQALVAYKQSISINPNRADVWSGVGNALTELKNYEAAMAAYDKAISLNPQFAEGWSNKANLLSKQSKYREAIECCNQALTKDGDYAPAWSNKAAFLVELQENTSAIDSANKALSLDPNYAKAWLNKGSALNNLSQHTDAIACFDKAIELQLNYPDAWANKAVALYDLLQLDECIQCCNKAIKLEPGHIEAHWTKSFAQLMLGNYEEGWINYEYRWNRKDADHRPHSDISQLTSLAGLEGKKILIWPEQGYGDILQFARYVPKLASLGAQVYFEVQEALVTLFQDQYSCNVITKGSKIPGMDFQLPLGSLPLLFKTTFSSIPIEVPYIQVNPGKVAEWKNKLPLSNEKLNIGIACSGNIQFDIKHGNKRPIPLTYFSELAKQHNLFLIQKEIRESDQETLQKLDMIHSLGELINNFEDTAAIVENMDLIISIDTSLVHLAGALGKKTIALLSWCPDWRWLVKGSSNPWYPSVTVVRQASAGDWDSVMREVETLI